MSSNLGINGGVKTTDASTLNRNDENRYEAWWNHRGSNWLNELWIARDVAANGAIPNVGGLRPYSRHLWRPRCRRTFLDVRHNPVLILGGTNFARTIISTRRWSRTM